MIGSDASSKLVLLVLSKCKSCHKRSPSLIKLGHTAVGILILLPLSVLRQQQLSDQDRRQVHTRQFHLVGVTCWQRVVVMDLRLQENVIPLGQNKSVR